MKKKSAAALVKFGDLVRKARTERNLSQSELAAKLDMDIRTLQRIECGKSNLRFANFFALVMVLGIDASIVLKEGEV